MWPLIYEELRHDGSNVYIGALCPGPIDTEFNKVAKVKFNLKSLNSYDVASYAIKKMFKKKTIIIPGFMNQMGMTFTRFLPRKEKLKICYQNQEKKR